MRLLFIRHGDPDYSIDNLTPQGRIEAQCLADYMKNVEVKDFYVSPLGRAQATAKYTLDAIGGDATMYPWLREFEPKIYRPDKNGELSNVSWDWLPADWMGDSRMYDVNRWYEHDVFKNSEVKEKYDMVSNGIDSVLASHGYLRQGVGGLYTVEQANNDTLAFFCHFGVTCVMLSHIINCSPMILWHNFCAAPTSITTVYTEERRPGVASFRVSGFGDVSHLAIKGENPSFSARFCECYDNESERHD